jgi:hypothetical protein
MQRMIWATNEVANIVASLLCSGSSKTHAAIVTGLPGMRLPPY